jgi:nicotinamidase-related amidase
MGKSALVIIDVQNYYMNGHTKDLPQKIAEFILGNNFDFIIFTKFVNNKNSSLSKLLNWKDCSASPEIDIAKDLLQFVQKDNIFEKSTYSIFKSKPLTKFLRKNIIKDLYFCGLDADACVLASAYEGFDLGLKVRVLEEITRSHCGNDFEESAMEIIYKNLQ